MGGRPRLRIICVFEKAPSFNGGSQMRAPRADQSPSSVNLVLDVFSSAPSVPVRLVRDEPPDCLAVDAAAIGIDLVVKIRFAGWALHLHAEGSLGGALEHAKGKKSLTENADSLIELAH